MEELLLKRKAPYIVDIDDAIFHKYDRHRSAIVRNALGRKLDRLFAGAALVTAGSGYLEARAKAAGAKWVERVPTVVDLTSYRVVPRPAADRCTIGWIGSPSTQQYLDTIRPVVKQLVSTGRFRFVTVGASFAEPLFSGHEQWPWSEDTEAKQVAEFDIGVMPLPDTPFERGKCAYKLIQYMACGIPVVASPVGANRDIVRHGENGFLAATLDEWKGALCRLADSPSLRHMMGAAGRADIEMRYSIQIMGPRVADLILQVSKMR